MKQQITVEYNAPVKVVTGMILWGIECSEMKTIYAKCPVCGGSNTLTVNGHTFSCPACSRLAKQVSFKHYTVKKYKVYGIEIDTNFDFWKDADEEPRVEFKLFRKYGRGTHESRTRRITESLLDPISVNEYRADNYAFSSYSKACDIARDLNTNEEAKLASFNANNGTDFAFEWKETNDKEEKARGSIA